MQKYHHTKVIHRKCIINLICILLGGLLVRIVFCTYACSTWTLVWIVTYMCLCFSLNFLRTRSNIDLIKMNGCLVELEAMMIGLVCKCGLLAFPLANGVLMLLSSLSKNCTIEGTKRYVRARGSWKRWEVRDRCILGAILQFYC